MTGNGERDLETLRTFYAGTTGRHPELASTIAFK
jgi:hypothetical protein